MNQWLKLVELEDYQDKFTQQQVDGRILLDITEETIKGTPYSMTDAHAKKFMGLREAFS